MRCDINADFLISYLFGHACTNHVSSGMHMHDENRKKASGHDTTDISRRDSIPTAQSTIDQNDFPQVRTNLSN